MDTLNLKWIACKNPNLRLFNTVEIGEKYLGIFIDEFLHDNDHLSEEDYDPTYQNIDFDNFEGGTVVFAVNYGYYIEIAVDKEYRVTKIEASSNDDEVYDIEDFEEDFYFEKVE